MGTSRCHPGLRWNLPGFKRGLVVLTCHLLRLSESVFLLPGFLCREAWKPLHPPSHPHEKWSRKEYLIAFSIPLFLSFLGYVVKIEMMTWAVEQLEDGVNYYAICERMEIEWNNNFFFFLPHWHFLLLFVKIPLEMYCVFLSLSCLSDEWKCSLKAYVCECTSQFILSKIQFFLKCKKSCELSFQLIVTQEEVYSQGISMRGPVPRLISNSRGDHVKKSNNTCPPFSRGSHENTWTHACAAACSSGGQLWVWVFVISFCSRKGLREFARIHKYNRTKIK